MALTPQEEAELQALETELAPKGGLTPSEEAELSALEAELAPKQKAPSAFDRAIGGAKTAIPFLQSAEQGFDYSGAEGAGRLAGDVGGTAAMLAFGIPRTLAAGAGLGAAMEGSGVGPAFREAGAGMESATNRALATDAPSKLLGIEGLGTAVNTATRVPGAALDVLANVLPYAIAGKAASGAMKPSAAPKIAPVNEGAALLQQHGGQVTPGMVSGTRTMGAMDWLAGKTLGGMNKAAGIEQANAQAVKNMLAGKLPQMSEAEAGLGVSRAIEDYSRSRGARFEGAERAALEALSGEGGPGMAASKAIMADLQRRGVPINETGFDPGATPMTASIDRPTATLLRALAQDLRQADAEGVINARRNLRANAPEILKASPESAALPAKQADAAMKKALNRAIYEQNPEAGMGYAKARQEYARTVDPVRRLVEGMAKENANPEQFVQQALKPTQGSGNLAMFKKYMTPEEFKPLQQGLARTLQQEAMSSGTGDYSAAKLGSALGTKYRHAVPFLEPEAARALSDAQKMLQTARIADTAVPQVSAGGNALNAQAIGLGAAGMAALGGSPLGLGAMLAAEAAAPLYLTSPQWMPKIPRIPARQLSTSPGAGALVGARMASQQ